MTGLDFPALLEGDLPGFWAAPLTVPFAVLFAVLFAVFIAAAFGAVPALAFPALFPLAFAAVLGAVLGLVFEAVWAFTLLAVVFAVVFAVALAAVFVVVFSVDFTVVFAVAALAAALLLPRDFAAGLDLGAALPVDLDLFDFAIAMIGFALHVRYNRNSTPGPSSAEHGAASGAGMESPAYPAGSSGDLKGGRPLIFLRPFSVIFPGLIWPPSENIGFNLIDYSPQRCNRNFP